MNREAAHFVKLDNGTVQCQLCPHDCKIAEGLAGVCGVRFNRGSTLFADSYGEVSSIGFDPIEKKPLYHYKPGTQILSVGSAGCNFDCGFCQNHSIARGTPKTTAVSPSELVDKAISLKEEGNIGIAFTYNEPTIWFEYIRDCATLMKKADLDLILVTNGFIKEAPLKELSSSIKAMNIDLKAFTEDFYAKVCRGRLQSVMDTISLANSFCHVELTTLLIGGRNDNVQEISKMSKWIASINPEIPLHLSRYHPSYRFHEPETSVESMMNCLEEAKKELKYVYLGNVWNQQSNTYCPSCAELLIERDGYEVVVHMTEKDNRCPKCGDEINIIR